MHSQFDSVLLPDPFAPIMAGADELPVPNRSLHRQRQNRAAMLAATRRLLAAGPDQFTLRRVSDECGVTVQTVRNSFGRREDLLVSALNEHTSAIWCALGAFSSGPTLFLDLAHMYYRCACATPDFLRAMVTTAIASNHPLANLQRHGVIIKVAYLRNMVCNGDLHPGNDLDALAAQITRLNTFMMYEWAMSGDAAELHRQMVGGNTLLLAGVVAPKAAAALKDWVPFPDRRHQLLPFG